LVYSGFEDPKQDNGSINKHTKYILDEEEVGVAAVVAQRNERSDTYHIKELYHKQSYKGLDE
jgi:hypothetical protein